jgi:hypothetical protein
MLQTYLRPQIDHVYDCNKFFRWYVGFCFPILQGGGHNVPVEIPAEYPRIHVQSVTSRRYITQEKEIVR